jgi:lysophospholipase L1-like esterase
MSNRLLVPCAAIGLLACAAGLAWAAGDDPPRPDPSERRAYAVAAIGDSLTDPRSHGGKYLDYVRARCPRSRFDNYGRGGEMVNQMRARFALEVLGEPRHPLFPKPRYSHVIVFGGVNDICSDTTAGRTLARIQTDLGRMYDVSKRRGMQVVAFTVAPWAGFTRYWSPKRGADTLALNNWIRAQTATGLVDSVVDAHALMSCGEPDKLCPRWSQPYDGLHFNPEGHRVLGAELFRRVFLDCE